ncbi:MAG: peptidylprolyl isomerase [Sphingobacteriales bacterium]|nr:MAG: peptidylprolyl isomerase [Sphingobacteriales bacterium]
MIKNVIPVAFLGISVLALGACNGSGGGYQKTKDGLEYKIIKDEKGTQKPMQGDIVQMHLHIHYSDAKTKDTVLFDSRKMNGNQPVEFPVMPAQFKGDWPEGITLLTPGDSATFKVSIDSIMKMGQGMLPPFMKKGEKVTYDVVLVSVKSKAEAEKAQQQQASQQSQIDDQKLQEFFKANNLTPQKTNSGLYYIIEKEGTGNPVQPGQVVSVMYTGKTLDGKSFDSNIDPQFKHTEPLEFPAGQGQVIRGWDEGIMLLKKGSKAKFFIPSPLAYGAQSPGPGIEANSVLTFEVELKDVKEKSAAAPQQMPVQ